VFGYDPAYPAPRPDLEEARRLLAEAGWGNGFSVVLDAPSGVYVEDARVAAFVAEALRPLGIAVRVQLLDKTTAFARQADRDTSFYLASWSCQSADMQEIFTYLLHTPDPARGFGSENAGGYSNPEVDRLAEQAAETMDPNERAILLRRAVRLALDDTPWVPLYIQTQVYALREPFRWQPRADRTIRVEDVTGLR